MSTLFESFLSDASAPVAPEPVPFSVNNNVTHKLTFRRGRARNFRSVGNEFMEVDYQRNQATLVTSDDNGAGKSTMLVWLPIFVLFNDTYSKREKKAGLVNSISRKECVGEIEFFTKGEEWKVRRGIKPDFVEIHQMVDGNWKQLENDAAKADTNKLIEEIIGIDQKMLENAIVLGKEKYIPFSEMMTADRRLMVETIWDLNFFATMNDDVKANIKSIQARLQHTDTDLTICQSNLVSKNQALVLVEQSNEALQQHSREALTFAENLETEMGTEHTALEDEIAEAEVRRNELKEQASSVRETVTKDAEGEVAVLIDSYEDPIAALQQETAAERDVAFGELERQQSGKQEILERQAALQEEYQLMLIEQKSITADLQDAMKTKGSGDTFKTRFQTEREGHVKAIQRFHDMGTCPTCNQEVGDAVKKKVADEYQPQIDDIDAKLALIDERQASVLKTIDNFNERMEALNEDMAVQSKGLEDLRVELRAFDALVEEKRRNITIVENRGAEAIRAMEKERDQRVVDLRADIARRANIAAQAIDVAIVEINEKLAVLNREETQLEDKIRGHRTYMADLRAKLAKEPTDTQPLRKEIDALVERKEDLEAQRVDLDNQLQDHNHLLFLLRDDQTKARIVSKYLPFLNSKVNEYLEGLNMFLQIQIDEKFEISMNSPDRKGQSIFSLSTGQRGRLNLAIMWALRDVANLKASVQCNILVMDEILENLSERGVQECVMLINNKFKNNNLFVVSQREQEFQEYFQHNIRYGLRNGLTTIIERN